MANSQLPSPEVVRQRLRYEPETGKLFWNACESQPPQWNGKWAGKEAFTTIGKNGYKAGRINWRLYYAHRVAWVIANGQWPAGQIDHINGDRTDNRIANLRECIPTENNMNAALPSNNTSGHIGVSLDKRSGRWEAHIGMPGTGRKLSLGLFDSMDFAIVARKAAERALGYHRNHGRVRQ